MRTLADALVAAQGKRYDQFFGGGVSALAEKVRKAKRFNFSPDAANAVARLGLSKPKSLLSAFRLAKLPFPETWVELDLSTTEKRNADDSEYPLRVGCLLEARSDDSFTMTFAYSFSQRLIEASERISGRQFDAEYGACVSLLSVGFDVGFRDMWLNTRSACQLPAPTIENVRVSRFDSLEIVSNEDRHALFRLLRSRIPNSPEVLKKYMGQLSGDAKRSEIESDMYGAMDGYIDVICGLCLLNSANCVQITENKIEDLNAARLKRGKVPFLSESTVSLTLGKRDARMHTCHPEWSGVRQHIVRGHFKVRAGKIFWWRPFLRGDAALGVVKRAGYEVNR